jgi:hypothetical protein
MSTKITFSQSAPPHNGQQNEAGDAFEPPAASDAHLSFHPADLQAASPAAPPTSAGPDQFDPASLRLPQDFTSTLGVKKVLLTVPIRKPDKAWWVRTHPDPSYRLQTAVIEVREDRGGETYLVDRSLWPELAGEATFSPRALVTAINRQGVLFMWPVRLPGQGGRIDEWSRTALAAVESAVTTWVRVASNMSLGAYEVFEASGNLGEPEWPHAPFRDLLQVAFKDRFIDSLDHLVLRRLRGEV